MAPSITSSGEIFSTLSTAPGAVVSPARVLAALFLFAAATPHLDDLQPTKNPPRFPSQQVPNSGRRTPAPKVHIADENFKRTQ